MDSQVMKTSKFVRLERVTISHEVFHHGKIRSWIGMSSTLQTLYLNDNNFIGGIPSSLS